MQKIVDAPAGRLAEGLRDTGYSFETAIADLVDNSIEAGATVVDISVNLNSRNEPLVQIADNGCGMDLAALENAMRYGADQKPDPNRLGWFGLGLKTASTSQCRRLTVVTRPSGESDIFAATWDLDVIAEANAWVLDIDRANVEEETIFADHVESALNVASGQSGTVVAWRKVDRLLRKPSGQDYVNPAGAIKRRVDSLEWHLRMVFQRYLDHSDSRVGNIDIRIDGRPLKPWDPFAEHFGVEPELVKKFGVTGRTGNQEVVLFRAFILPKPDEMDDPVAYREYVRSSGNERQGFFFYRENRLIDVPGWIAEWVNETHLRRLRIEVSFPATLDPYFGVGLRKAGLQPDKSFLEMIDDSITALRREANRRDRKGSAHAAVAEASGRPNPSDRIIDTRRGELEAPEVTTSPDKGTVIANNQPEDLVIIGPDGAPNPSFRIEVLADPTDVYVVLADQLEGAGMWEPALRLNAGRSDLMVRVNAHHEWVRRAYSAHPQGSAERMALDFLFYALATAEMNNTDEELRREFGQFRTEVSRNLERLASELWEPPVND